MKLVPGLFFFLPCRKKRPGTTLLPVSGSPLWWVRIAGCLTPVVLAFGVAGCASVWPHQEATYQVEATVSAPTEARWTDTTWESVSTPAHRRVLQRARPKTITGEVVDVSCFLQLGKRGEAHIPCGQKCVRNGQPIGIVTDSGKLYLLMPEEHHPRRDGTVSLRECFAELLGKRVTVSGMATKYQDYRGLFVRSLPKEE